MIALPSKSTAAAPRPTNTALPPPAVPPAEQRPPSADKSVVDLRFRALIGEDSWARLPAAVQKRFSKRLSPGAAVVYAGAVLETRLSRAGKVVSFLARMIGAPLPLDDGMTGAAVVTVTENEGLGGQCWTRTYARRGRFPQVIHSAKCFAGPTGLEEYVGYGVGMSLAVTEREGALVFRSTRYVLAIGGLRMRLPRLLEPGAMEVVHKDEGGGAFLFTLALTHPWLGELVYQTARFRDA
jgi:hypothetical protein